MSRLCRLRNKSHGEDGQWAYEEIVRLREQVSEIAAAKHMQREVDRVLVENHTLREQVAAQAAGIEYTANDNPLVSDALALRMAVKLRLSFAVDDSYIVVHGYGRPNLWIEYYEGDPYAATRRAIVRAAAEIGKESK